MGGINHPQNGIGGGCGFYHVQGSPREERKCVKDPCRDGATEVIHARHQELYS